MEQCFHVFSILDHLDAMKLKVSPNALAENHSICSAAGAICVANDFTQSNGRLTIANSSAKTNGGAVHLGAPSGGFRDVASAGFEAVVGSF